MKKKVFKQTFVHRITALLLVVLMIVLLLPYYEGEEGSSKAAEIVTEEALFKVEYNYGESLLVQGQGGFTGVNGSDDYVLSGISAKDDYFAIGDNVQFKVQFTNIVLPDSYELTYQSNKYQCTIEYRYLVNGTRPSDKYSKNDGDTLMSDISLISMSNNQYLGIYARLVLPSEFPEDDYISNDTMGYVLVAYLSAEAVADGFADGAEWKNSTGSQYQNGTFVNNAKISQASMTHRSGKIYLGKAKYLYIDAATYNNNIGDLGAFLSNQTWSETPPEIGVVNGQKVNASGTYYGFVGYFDNNGNGKLISFKELGAVNLDTDAPKIISGAILYTSGEGQQTILSSDKEFHYVPQDDEGTYQLQIVTDEKPDYAYFYQRKVGEQDWGDFISVHESPASTTIMGGVTKQDITTVGLEFRVVVKDNAGNESEYIFTPKLKLVDDKLAIDRIALVELVNGKYSPVNFNELNEEDGMVYINKQYYLMVEASSGNMIKRMRVTYDHATSPNSGGSSATSVIEITEEENTLNEIGRYSVTGYIPLLVPDMYNAPINVILKNLSVMVEEYDGDTDETNNPSITVTGSDSGIVNGKTLSDYFYDETKPEITFYDEASKEVVNTDKWYQDFTLGYAITQGYMSDGIESRLASVSYFVDGGRAISVLGNNSVKELSGFLVVPESQTAAGTKILFNATDLSGNKLKEDNGQNKISIKVDKHAPTVVAPFVNGKQNNQTALSTANGIAIRADIKDNLTLSQVAFEVTYPDGTHKERKFNIDYNAMDSNGVQASYSTTLSAITGDTNFADGEYAVSVVATDKSGRKSNKVASRFEIDNTAPEVGVKISSGTDGGKNPRNYYYNSNVTVELTCLEKNIDITNELIVEDNGVRVTPTWTQTQSRYVAYYTVSREGLHNIAIRATDKAGTQAQSKSVSFVIDKTAPGIGTIVNGAIAYTETMGALSMLGDTTIGVSVTDMTADANDLNYRVIQTKPGQATNTSMYWKTTNRSFLFTEEADYTVNFYAVDMANNTSATRSVNFRIDKTAPNISISGVGGGTSASVATVTFTMREAFWWDASGTVTIYRKAGDGSEEQLLKTIDFSPTSYETSVRETLTDTGVYRMEFSAEDRVGHRVNTSQTFTIDREAPKITLTGVNNYDMTSESVNFVAQVTDEFYSSKKVTVNGTRIDVTGKKNIIGFSSFNEAGNPSIISETFTEDGIYDIEVSSVDVAGNSHSSKVHFIIDKTAPVIGDLSAFDGVTLKEFVWDYDLDELVSDLTVCDVHMYLNGIEYDGVSEIEDGSYILLITAEDELGQYSEKSVEFILDTKAPVFIVTGVEDGEVKNEQYDISVSLQLDEDTLTSVSLNGKEMSIDENVSSFSVADEGNYTLTMRAVDAAGNEAKDTIEFRFGEENSTWWIWIVIGCCAIMLLAIIALVLKKYRENEK